MTTYNELMTQAESLMAQAEQVRKQERASAISEIQAKMLEHGLTVEDLAAASRKQTASKPKAPADNPTPGRLIGKMDGVYVPPKSVMRSGALDHQACASLHAGVSRPYTGQPLTLGVRAK